jgi:hypothetical protein
MSCPYVAHEADFGEQQFFGSVTYTHAWPFSDVEIVRRRKSLRVTFARVAPLFHVVHCVFCTHVWQRLRDYLVRCSVTRIPLVPGERDEGFHVRKSARGKGSKLLQWLGQHCLPRVKR